MRTRTVPAALALGTLLGCSGGDGGDSPAVGAALAPPPGDTSPPASEIDTDTLVGNAAERARGHLDVALESVAAAVDGGALRTGLATVVGDGAGAALLQAFGGGDDAPTPGLFADGAAPSPVAKLFADAPDVGLDAGAGTARDAADRFIETTLRGEGAVTSREGDRITIDPDEAALCADGALGSSAPADCAALLGRTLVVLDAVRAESGTVRWLFDGVDVLRVAYGPEEGGYELALAGLGALGRAAAELGGEPDPVPDAFEGAVRLVASVRSREPGAEAARLSLFVSEPVRIEDADTGTRFGLGASVLWSIDADAGAGTFASRASIGPLSLAGRLDGGAGPAFALEVPGWTVDASAARDEGTLEVSSVGIGAGEATLMVDGATVLRARLPLTSFAVEGDATRFDAPLDAALDLVLPEVGEASWRFAAPAGTRLADRGLGVVEVEAGGPWRVEERYAVGDERRETVHVAGAGECFDTGWSDADGDGTPSRFAAIGCP